MEERMSQKIFDNDLVAMRKTIVTQRLTNQPNKPTFVEVCM